MTPEERKRYEEIRAELDEQMRPLLEENEACRRITADDLAVTITNPDRWPSAPYDPDPAVDVEEDL